MNTEAPRYAIYYAPESRSDLWRFGSSVIGCDAASGTDVPFLTTGGMRIAEWSALTAEPRRYGFHATLKAPFHLADGFDETRLLERASAIASAHTAVALEKLQVAVLSGFIALKPTGDITQLTSLASAMVDAFDDLRAPLTPADRARRLSAPLTARQIAYLDRYGYPHVLEEFRFHMTLTGKVPLGTIDDLRSELANRFAEARVPSPIMVGGLTIFRQDRRTSRFRIIARFPLRCAETSDSQGS